MQDTINQRIKFYIENKKIDRRKFCEETGIKYSTLSSILNSQNTPSFAIIEAMLKFDYKINPYWLILNLGNPDLSEEKDRILNEIEMLMSSFEGVDNQTGGLLDALYSFIQEEANPVFSVIENAKSINNNKNIHQEANGNTNSQITQTVSEHTSEIKEIFKKLLDIETRINKLEKNK